MENSNLCSDVCPAPSTFLLIKTLPLSKRTIRAYPNGSLGTPILVIKILLHESNPTTNPRGVLFNRTQNDFKRAAGVGAKCIRTSKGICVKNGTAPNIHRLFASKFNVGDVQIDQQILHFVR
jgi:hypothetical protein